jgi:hypothetical protein
MGLKVLKPDYRIPNELAMFDKVGLVALEELRHPSRDV